MCFKWTDDFIVNCQDSSPNFPKCSGMTVLRHFFRS